MKAPSDALASIAIAAMARAAYSALRVDDAFGDAHHPGVVKLAEALADDTQRARIECAIVCALEETPDAVDRARVKKLDAPTALARVVVNELTRVAHTYFCSNDAQQARVLARLDEHRDEVIKLIAEVLDPGSGDSPAQMAIAWVEVTSAILKVDPHAFDGPGSAAHKAVTWILARGAR